MKMKNKLQLLSIILIISLVLQIFPTFAHESEIVIMSAKDFVEFAQNCSLDTWSIDKKVTLVKDIDLSSTKFTAVPTFSGTFDGNGYTISGIRLDYNGSAQGLFRYVTEGGTVKNLKVKGTVSPGGTANKIGGIAGLSEGNIINCEFIGNVNGKSYVGGICGINASTGSVTECTSQGSVFGEHYVGGIVGQNFGTVTNCTNTSQVNNTASTIKLDIEEIDFDNLFSTQNTNAFTDIGGICGYSVGIISSCVNSAVVGYPHIGYNIGGICGRQSGYISSCRNTAKVYGRKDVGGIVGQMEPYSAIKYSDMGIYQVTDELDKLKSILDSTISSGEDLTSSVSQSLSNIKANTDNAITSADNLAQKTKDLLNTNIDSINNTGVRFSDCLDKISSALDYCDLANENINDFLDYTNEALDLIDTVCDIDNTDVDNIIEDTKKSISNLQTSLSNLSSAMRKLNKATNDIDDISSAVKQVKKAIDELNSSIDDLKNQFDKIKSVLDNASTAVKNAEFENLSEYFTELGNAAKEISQLCENIKLSNEKVKNHLNDLIDAVLAFDVDNIGSAASYLGSAFKNLSTSLGYVYDILDIIQGKINFNNLEALPDVFKNMTNSLNLATDNLSAMTNGIGDAFEELAKEPVISITKIDEDYTAAADDFSNNISAISDALENMNLTAKDGINNVTDNLRAVSDQFAAVTDAITQALEEAYTTDIKDDLESRISDISEEDTQGQTTGKVSRCINTGFVEGDVNVGGIAGCSAIEYDFDPEDDITHSGTKSANFIFTTRSIIRECENKGEIIGKKNCIGGIVGKLNLGCVIKCIGGGYISSKNGDYVGAIAGSSDSVIKLCSAKATVSGDDYIGGIAGEAEHIYDCESTSYIENGDENVGSIAGSITNTCARNYFLDYGIGGVDFISISGIAEPKSLDEFSDNVKTVNVIFKNDDEVIKTTEVEANGTLSDNLFPKIEPTENCYISWNTENVGALNHDIVISATQTAYITSIESDKTIDNNIPIVTSEGLYTEKSVLTVSEADKIPDNAFCICTEALTVTATDNANNTSKIHYHLPEKCDSKAQVFIYDGNKYRKVESEIDGSYIVFEGNKAETTFAITQRTLLYKILQFLFYFLIAAIIVIVLLLVAKRAVKLVKNKYAVT